jgi:hypothetical protein
VQADQRNRRHHREGVELRIELAHPAEQALVGVLVAEHGRLDDDQVAAAQRRWQFGDGRELEQLGGRGDLLGHAGAPLSHAPRTSRARSQGHTSQPAYSSGTG